MSSDLDTPCYESNEVPEHDLNDMARRSELIRVACQALIREADTQSAKLLHQYKSNAADYRAGRSRQMFQARIKLNCLLPVNKLPEEILGHILVQAVAAPEYSGVRQKRVHRDQLASVSRYWRHVVFETPQLWCWMEDSMSCEELERAERKSMELLLDVHFTGTYDCSFTERVGPVSSRWRSLQADSKMTVSDILAVLGLRLPALVDLCLSPSEVDRSVAAQLGDGRHLENLNLSRIALNWDSPRFQNLTSLRLDGIHRSSAAPWQCLRLPQLASILSSCPDLESLRLSALVQWDPPANVPSAPAPIVLPRLSRLLLQDLESSMYVGLLSCLSFPSCANMVLRPLSYDTVHHFDHGEPSFAVRLKRLFSSRSNARVEYDPWGVSLSTGAVVRKNLDGDGVCVSITTRTGNQAQLALEQVLRIVEVACPNNPLDLVIARDIDEEQLMRLPMTRSIVVRGHSTARPILRYLGEPHRSGVTDERSWPYPHLEKIDLSNASGYTASEIRSWVKSRWTRLKNSQGKGVVKYSGSVQVIMPMGKDGSPEEWRPNKKLK